MPVVDDQPVTTPIRASLNRPQLLMGGDRDVVVALGGFCALVAVTVMSFVSFVIGFVTFLVCTGVLARIGKADPLMRKVYGRHVRYTDFYPAKSGVFRQGRPTKMNWRA